MALFVQVAETGSLSRAAEELGLSNAAASRHLSALEERLGARLVERNTRRLYLTEPGQEFLRRSKAILADLQRRRVGRQRLHAQPHRHAARDGLAVVLHAPHRAAAAGVHAALPQRDGARRDGQPLPGPDRQQHRRGDPHARVRARLQHHHPPAGRDAAHPGRVAGLPGRAGTPRDAGRPGAARAAGLHLRQQPARTALHARRRDHARCRSRACWNPTTARCCAPPRSTAWASWCSPPTSSTTTSWPAGWCRCWTPGTCRA